MKLVKSLLLGSAAGLFAVAGAQAADLPVKLDDTPAGEFLLQVVPVGLRRRKTGRQLTATLSLDAHRGRLGHVFVKGAGKIDTLVKDDRCVVTEVIEEAEARE